MKEELGDEWLMNDLFRIGASSLLTDLERQLYHFITVTTPRNITCQWDNLICKW